MGKLYSIANLSSSILILKLLRSVSLKLRSIEVENLSFQLNLVVLDQIWLVNLLSPAFRGPQSGLSISFEGGGGVGGQSMEEEEEQKDKPAGRGQEADACLFVAHYSCFPESYRSESIGPLDNTMICRRVSEVEI